MAVSCAFFESKPEMLLSDFDYHLPQQLIAQAPLDERAASRLLLLDPARHSYDDRSFSELPSLLEARARGLVFRRVA